jgi:hypothetical protein
MSDYLVNHHHSYICICYSDLEREALYRAV